jgi:hypothetical protein
VLFKKQQKVRFSKNIYTFKSGRTTHYQGYEAFCITDLLKKYQESELLFNINEMPNKFWYRDEEDKKRKYFPDIYIKSEKKFIEVKSEYTARLEPMRVANKMKSVIDAGYTIDLMIYDKKRNCLGVFNHD